MLLDSLALSRLQDYVLLGLIGEKRERILVKKWLRRFREDRRGVAWVVGVAVISILLMPVVYYPLDYAWDVVFYSVTGGYVFTGTTASAVTFVKVIINYLIVFGLLFTINWAIVQAKARRNLS
jgi:hypothetical protein